MSKVLEQPLTRFSLSFVNLAIPICAANIIYSKYNALKTLKPASNLNLLFATSFIYLGARIVSMGVCLQVMREKCPEFDLKLKRFKEQQQLAAGLQPPYQPQQQQNQMRTVDQDYQSLQRQRFSNPNNPYLAANQPKENEFVEDNYDFGDSKSSNQ